MATVAGHQPALKVIGDRRIGRPSARHCGTSRHASRQLAAPPATWPDSTAPPATWPDSAHRLPHGPTQRHRQPRGRTQRRHTPPAPRRQLHWMACQPEASPARPSDAATAPASLRQRHLHARRTPACSIACSRNMRGNGPPHTARCNTPWPANAPSLPPHQRVSPGLGPYPLRGAPDVGSPSPMPIFHRARLPPPPQAGVPCLPCSSTSISSPPSPKP
mmetsp:Transcript_2013/g.5281  ORF Transcript_2013/g.5281 Transcript_2013/m.5281 type:complete len:218 (-) Transcript_2013:220-873(-)